MAFCVAIRRDSVSLIKFLFLCHFQVFLHKILLVCLLKCPYSCFSSCFCFNIIIYIIIIIIITSLSILKTLLCLLWKKKIHAHRSITVWLLSLSFHFIIIQGNVSIKQNLISFLSKILKSISYLENTILFDSKYASRHLCMASSKELFTSKASKSPENCSKI